MTSEVETQHIFNTNWSTAGDTVITVTLDNAPDDDDVLIFWGFATNPGGDITLPSGFTLLDDTLGVRRSFLGYKLASSDGTTYDFTTDNTSSGSDGLAFVSVIRGSDPARIFDVTFDSDLHYQGDSNLTPPPITTQSTNAFVMTLICFVSSGTPPGWTYPTGYTELDVYGSGGFNTHGAGVWDVITTPGIETPSDWGIGGSASSRRYTVAIKDVDSISVQIPDVFWGPSTGWDYVDTTVGPNGNVIPPKSVLYEETGVHITTDNSSTLKVAGTPWSTNQWIGHRVRNIIDRSSGVVTGNTSSEITAPLSGGSSNLWDIGNTYEIVINSDTGDQLVYNTASTVSITSNGVPSVSAASGTHAFDCKLRDITDSKRSSIFTVT